MHLDRGAGRLQRTLQAVGDTRQPRPLARPVGHVDQVRPALPGGLARLAGDVVAQVGGDEDVRPLARTASSSPSPAPPQTATLDTSPMGSPAMRTPWTEPGSASATSIANSRSVVGAASLPTRPMPRGPDRRPVE